MKTHGTESSYAHGCHCNECKAGHAEYSRQHRNRCRQKARADYNYLAGRKHGSTATYADGCMCDECRAAEKYMKQARISDDGRSRLEEKCAGANDAELLAFARALDSE